jgi:ribulose-5-phosphate 4-epimerase/fuculose-1-phosphate aldolase
MPSPQSEVAELIRVARSLFSRGYSFGTAGNLSFRIGDSVYATPTGSSFETVQSSQIAVCTMDGLVAEGRKTNFGSTEFYSRAIEAIRQLPYLQGREVSGEI